MTIKELIRQLTTILNHNDYVEIKIVKANGKINLDFGTTEAKEGRELKCELIDWQNGGGKMTKDKLEKKVESLERQLEQYKNSNANKKKQIEKITKAYNKVLEQNRQYREMERVKEWDDEKEFVIALRKAMGKFMFIVTKKAESSEGEVQKAYRYVWKTWDKLYWKIYDKYYGGN